MRLIIRRSLRILVTKIPSGVSSPSERRLKGSKSFPKSIFPERVFGNGILRTLALPQEFAVM